MIKRIHFLIYQKSISRLQSETRTLISYTVYCTGQLSGAHHKLAYDSYVFAAQ